MLAPTTKRANVIKFYAAPIKMCPHGGHTLFLIYYFFFLI